MKQNAWNVLTGEALKTLETAHSIHPHADLIKDGTIFTISQRMLPNDHASTLLAMLNANPDLFYRTPRGRAIDDTLTDTARLVIEEALYEILTQKWNEILQTS